MSPEDLQRWADADGFDLQHPPRPAYVPEKLQLIEVALPGENPTFMGFWGLFWGGFWGAPKQKRLVEVDLMGKTYVFCLGIC